MDNRVYLGRNQNTFMIRDFGAGILVKEPVPAMIDNSDRPELRGRTFDHIIEDKYVPISDKEMRVLPDFHGKVESGVLVRRAYASESRILLNNPVPEGRDFMPWGRNSAKPDIVHPSDVDRCIVGKSFFDLLNEIKTAIPPVFFERRALRNAQRADWKRRKLGL